jgi:hypothetical protein
VSFLSILALGVVVFVAAPIAAHLLRRRRTEERLFPAAKLIPATPPTARRRSMLEDRTLFALRALAIVTLAVLGATPFVSCSHVAIERKGGASVALAIVVDDSLSMRAPFEGERTRFDRAKAAAAEIVAGARSGDSIALVLAGTPPRVAMATTTDLEAARAAVAEMRPSDRATDLDGALHVAADLVRSAPQRDKRVVVLSDRADGNPDGPPLAGDAEVSLWEPLPELGAKGEADCGVVGADRTETRVLVHIVCTDGSSNAGRAVTVSAGGKSIATVTPKEASPTVVLELPRDAPADLDVTLAKGDAIAADDVAPVSQAGADLAVGIVADPARNRLETGGPPPIEQAFAALDLGRLAKPLPGVPEHEEDLKGLSGLILDDPPGLTPESRKVVEAWVERGGALLVSLGRTASAAPLGAGFGGLFPGVVRFGPSTSTGADPTKCTFFGGSAESLVKLSPEGRTSLDHAAVEDARVLCAFDDGAPLFVERTLGRGSVLLSTLPFGVEESDLPLRPAFLTLIDRFADQAQARGGTRHVEAGQSFTFAGAKKVTGAFVPSDGGAPRPITVAERDGLLRAVTEVAGRYEVQLDGAAETRVATVPAREIDLRARRVSESARSAAFGGKAPKVDASPWVALFLLGLVALELVVRVVTAQRVKEEA